MLGLVDQLEFFHFDLGRLQLDALLLQRDLGLHEYGLWRRRHGWLRFFAGGRAGDAGGQGLLDALGQHLGAHHSAITYDQVGTQPHLFWERTDQTEHVLAGFLALCGVAGADRHFHTVAASGNVVEFCIPPLALCRGDQLDGVHPLVALGVLLDGFVGVLDRHVDRQVALRVVQAAQPHVAGRVVQGGDHLILDLGAVCYAPSQVVDIGKGTDVAGLLLLRHGGAGSGLRCAAA